MDLNNPQTRQTLLCERLDPATPLVAAALADELGVSVDTVRRDLIALERRGLVRRVRGGALPVAPPPRPYAERAAAPEADFAPLAQRAVRLLPRGGAVFLDGGATLDAVAAQLPQDFGGLIVTPSPSAALAALRRGAEVQLIGGALLAQGAMATGGAAERAIADVAADLCILGACGLWPGFGLSAEDAGEAGVKRAMALASARVLVAASAQKIARRGRLRVLTLDEIDDLVTDAPPEAVTPFRDAGIAVHHV